MKFSTDIRGPQRINPTDFSDPLTLPLMPPAGLHFLVAVLTTVEWIAMKFGTGLYDAQRMNCYSFGDLLTLIYDLIPYIG